MTSGPSIDWLDDFSDRLNPMFVRELRQVVKSRRFAISFLVTLAIFWLVMVCAAVQIGEGFAYGSPGRPLFAIFVTLLNFALCTAVPLSVFHSLASEFDGDAFESLMITTLSPERIVLGKLESALLQMAVFSSAGAPFLTFAYLAQGVGLIDVVMALVISFLASLSSCFIAILAGALGRFLFVRTVGPVAVVCGGIFVANFASLVSTALAGPVVLRIGDFVGGVCCIGTGLFFLGMMAMAIGIGQFTREVPLDYHTTVTRRNNL